MKDSNPPVEADNAVIPNPEVQLPAIEEIGSTANSGTCKLYYKAGEPWVRILALGHGQVGPSGWTEVTTESLAANPFVLTPDHIVVVGAGAYCVMTAGWGLDPRKSKLALVEGLAIKGSIRPQWIDAKDWATFPHDVVRVIHPCCPPVLYTRRQTCLDIGTVEELFTTVSCVRILA